MKLPEFSKYIQVGIVSVQRKYSARCLIRHFMKSSIQKFDQPLDGKYNTIQYLLIEDILNTKIQILIAKIKVKSRLVYYAYCYACVSSKLSKEVNVNSLFVKGISVIRIESFPGKNI